MPAATTPRKQGFTLIELLIVIAIIALLAAILFPVFARVRENARRSSCQSNMRQIAMATLQYTQDYDERLLPRQGAPWQPWIMASYVKSNQIWRCPSSPNDGEEFNGTPGDIFVSYGYNMGWLEYASLASVAKPSETLLWVESFDPSNKTGVAVVHPRPGLPGHTAAFPLERHLERCNVAYLDGHIKALKAEVIEQQQNDEDGQPLVGIERYVLWNRL